MQRAVVLLCLAILTVGLAGCLGPETVPGPQVRGFDGLEAPGATDVRRGSNGTLTFVFEGAREELLPNGIAWTFEVDGRVGYVQVDLESQAAPIGTNGAASSGVSVELIDHLGRDLCEAAGGAIVPACSSLMPSNLTGPVEWQIEADAGGTGTAKEERFTVEVTLHPPGHVARQDPTVPTDPGLAFAVHDTGVRNERGMEEPSVGTLGDGRIFVQAGLKTLASSDAGRSFTDVSPPAVPPRSFDPMLETDPYTGRVYTDQLTLACCRMAASSWPTPTRARARARRRRTAATSVSSWLSRRSARGSSPTPRPGHSRRAEPWTVGPGRSIDQLPS